MFPDAVTVRGTRHLLELAELSKEGKKAVVLFLVHWAKADFFMPEWHTDLELARTMLAVRDKVQIMALSVAWMPDLTPGHSRDSHSLGSGRTGSTRPGELYLHRQAEKGPTAGDRRVGRDKVQKRILLLCGFRKGRPGQEARTASASRKKLFSHIDHLRAAADYHAAIPIRASEDLDAGSRPAWPKIADWEVPGFGSSECGCSTHLYGLDEDPVHNRSFIDLLMYFRMDRLEKYLDTH